MSTDSEAYPAGSRFIELKFILLHFSFWDYLVQVLFLSASKLLVLYSFISKILFRFTDWNVIILVFITKMALVYSWSDDVNKGSILCLLMAQGG